jgi:hypothetical protein
MASPLYEKNFLSYGGSTYPPLTFASDGDHATPASLITNPGPPSDGTSGTGAARAHPGSLCVDITNMRVYTNVNTKASPTWLEGVTRPRPDRFGYTWVAGAQGLPQLSAVTQIPAADTYDTSDFLANMRADQHFEVLGTNAVSSCVTYNAEGGIKLTTTTAGNDQVIILPHLTTTQSPWKQTTWGTDRSIE